MPDRRLGRRSGRLTPDGRLARRRGSELAGAQTAARGRSGALVCAPLSAHRWPHAPRRWCATCRRPTSSRPTRPTSSRPTTARSSTSTSRACSRTLAGTPLAVKTRPGAQRTGAEGARERGAGRVGHFAWPLCRCTLPAGPIAPGRLLARPAPSPGAGSRSGPLVAHSADPARLPLLLLAGATWRTRSTRTRARFSSRSTPSVACPSTGEPAPAASKACCRTPWPGQTLQARSQRESPD